MTAEERYTRDPEFRAIVDALESFVARGQYTPTELREALIMAMTHYEMSRPPRPIYLGRHIERLRQEFPIQGIEEEA